MEKPFDEGHAWVDLLLLAENDEKTVTIAGVKIQQKPGSVLWSKKDLMARWGWTRWRFDKTIAKWKALGMITEDQHRNQHRNQHRIVTELTIVKWAFFQSRRRKTSTENDTENDILLKKNKEGDRERLTRRVAKKKMERRLNPETGAWEVTVVD